LSLPLLMILTFGIIECCDAVFLKQSLTLAAQEGARVAVVPGANSENVRVQVRQILQARGVQEDSIEIRPPNFASAPFGSLITVRVDARVDQNSSSFMGILSGHRVTGSTTMMMEHN